MPERHAVTDQLGRVVDLPRSPERIVSLCPSTTETVCALGARGRLVGRTDYCVRPDDVDDVPSVGGTKKVRLERLEELDPDLVLAVREENERGQVEAIAERWPVFVLDPVDVATAVDGIARLGAALGRAIEDGAATALAERVRAAFADLAGRGTAGLRALYLIWRKPWMAAGAGTYIDDVMRHLGVENAARHLPGRYPEIEAGAAVGVDAVLASSEPFPFSAQHVPELAGLVGDEPDRVLLVDGEAFSWHGVRMLEAADALARVRERLGALGRRVG